MHDRLYKLAAHQHKEHHPMPGDEHDGHKFEVLLFGLQPERIEQHLRSEQSANEVIRYFLGHWQGLPQREADPQRIKLEGSKSIESTNSRRAVVCGSPGVLFYGHVGLCLHSDRIPAWQTLGKQRSELEGYLSAKFRFSPCCSTAHSGTLDATSAS